MKRTAGRFGLRAHSESNQKPSGGRFPELPSGELTGTHAKRVFDDYWRRQEIGTGFTIEYGVLGSAAIITAVLLGSTEQGRRQYFEIRVERLKGVRALMHKLVKLLVESGVMYFTHEGSSRVAYFRKNQSLSNDEARLCREVVSALKRVRYVINDALDLRVVGALD